MNAMTQGWQVARADLWRIRWMLLVIVVALAYEIRSAISYLSFAPDDSFFVPWPAMLIAGLVTMLVVQHDPPSRADAYWMAIPIRARSVFAGKAITLMVIVLMATGALLLTIVIAGSGDSKSTLALCKSFVMSLSVMAMCVLAASVARTVVGAVFALLSLYLTLMFSLEVPLLLRREWAIGMSAPFSDWKIELVSSMVVLCVVLWMYVLRPTRLRAWAIALLLMMATAVSRVLIPNVFASEPPIAPLAAGYLHSIKTSAMTAHIEDGNVHIEFDAFLPDSVKRVRIVQPRAVLSKVGEPDYLLRPATVDGLEQRNSVGSMSSVSFTFDGNGAVLERVEAYGWPGYYGSNSTRNADGSVHIHLVFLPHDSTRNRLIASGTRVSFSGFLEEQQRRTVLELKTADGDTIRFGLSRLLMRVQPWNPDSPLSKLAVDVRAIGDASNPFLRAVEPTTHRALYSQLHAIGYPVAPFREGMSYQLVDSSGRDTLTFHDAWGGLGFNLISPVGRQVHAEYSFGSNRADDQARLRRMVDGGRMIIGEWTYAGHTALSGEMILK